MKLIKNYGAIPTYRRKDNEVSIMRVMSIMKVINKRAVPYSINGKSGESYKAMVTQNDDSEMGEERISADVYNQLERNMTYEFRGVKRTSRDQNGERVRIIWDTVKPVANNEKAIME